MLLIVHWYKSLIDRLELGDQTAEEDAILYVKIENGLTDPTFTTLIWF